MIFIIYKFYNLIYIEFILFMYKFLNKVLIFFLIFYMWMKWLKNNGSYFFFDVNLKCVLMNKMNLEIIYKNKRWNIYDILYLYE